MIATPIDFREPVHSDEIFLAGSTFIYNLKNEYLDGQNQKKIKNIELSIFVPYGVSDLNKSSPNASCNILLFFTALQVTETFASNDMLNHGVRYAAESFNFIVIFLPVPLEAEKPNFITFSNNNIDECLKAIDIKLRVEKISLVAHSRGNRGLTRTLMGNNLEVWTGQLEKSPSDKFASYIDLSKVIRIIYLDNYYQSSEKVLSELINKKLIDKRIIKVVHASTAPQSGVIKPNPLVLDNFSEQFIELNDCLDIVTIVAFYRFITSANQIQQFNNLLSLTNPSVKYTTKLIIEQMPPELRSKYLRLNALSIIPPRLSFSTALSGNSLVNQINFKQFCKTQKKEIAKFFDMNKDIQLLVNFIGSSNLTQMNLDKSLFQHHHFVPEFAHEFFV